MLTPTRVLVGLLLSCCLSLLTLILSIGTNQPLAYLGLAGYVVSAAGFFWLVILGNLGKLPAVLRLPTIQWPTLPAGSRVLLLGVAAVCAFLFLPPLVRLVYPEFGGFAPDTINAYTLGACQHFLALTMAYAAWRLIFPRLYTYATETMEGKLLESITADLLVLFAPTATPLEALAKRFGKPYEALRVAINDAIVGEYERLKEFGLTVEPADAGWLRVRFAGQSQLVETPRDLGAAILRIATNYSLEAGIKSISLAEIAERRKIATFQFTVRCVRFIFSTAPFFLFYYTGNAALTSALTAVPAAVPA